MPFLRALRNLGRMVFARGERAPEVDPDEARRLQAGGALIVDVREEAEWRSERVPGAVHIPLGELEDRLDEIPRDRTVVVHCAMGGRSAMAAKRLSKLGVKDVRNLRGGIRAWARAKLPLTRAR